MRKNCKRSRKMSVIASTSMHAVAIVMAVFGMVIVNMLADSSCDHLLKGIGAKERQLKALEDNFVRQNDRWEMMKSPAKLEAALLKLGLAMKYPKPDQIVRMDGSGRPCPGQRSVARAQSRSAVRQTAQVSRGR